MTDHLACNRAVWIILSIAFVGTPGGVLSQIDSSGACAKPGLVMAGVFISGEGLFAGSTGSRMTSGPLAVRDWPFRLECVDGRLQLTSGRVNGATEVTHAVLWMQEEPHAFLVAFRGADDHPQGPLILFAVWPGLLRGDTPVVTYTSTDGKAVFMYKGSLATTEPDYAMYVPRPWR